ncbi:MAG: amino-acid N-acetyltransferase [Gulosibacter sp.]|uniref:amino-acid N-acetyltransferase n=1 Tax=Gulosibacter sp. TaxID=2817531 RepID=UPI003F922346
MQQYTIRRARTPDVVGIQSLIQPMVDENILLGKGLVVLYEAVQEFVVAETPTGEIVGCGALHVLWRDLGEVRTIATSAKVRGDGVGHQMLVRLITDARELGLERLFCLTFETEFFGRHGFEAVNEQVVDEATFREMLHSPDAGTAEFLDLPWVKPNTLGNTRMILQLQ